MCTKYKNRNWLVRTVEPNLASWARPQRFFRKDWISGGMSSNLHNHYQLTVIQTHVSRQNMQPTRWHGNTQKLLLQFSHSVVSNTLWPHEPEHTRPLCASPIPGVYPNSCPLSRWCHPTISSSVVPFSACPQSLSASESFPMSQLFTSGGQSTAVSASAAFLPKKSQGWSPSEWIGWISLQSKGLSSLLQHHSSKASILWG